MNTKVLIVLAWMSYFALRQTADGFWLFCCVYSCVLATCSYFFQQDQKPHTNKKKKNPNN